MTLWNDVVRLQDELGTHGARRHMAAHQYDVQVSVGYLHAGYPTQGPLVAARTGGYGTSAADRILGLVPRARSRSAERPDKSWGWNNAYLMARWKRP